MPLQRVLTYHGISLAPPKEHMLLLVKKQGRRGIHNVEQACAVPTDKLHNVPTTSPKSHLIYLFLRHLPDFMMLISRNISITSSVCSLRR